MTDQPAASEPNANEELAPSNDRGRGGMQHLLVGGAALATMAFVLGLWVIRGGSLGMLLGDDPAVAASAPAASTQNPITALRKPQVVSPTAAEPVPASTPDVGQKGQPVAIAPNGVPVFTVSIAGDLVRVAGTAALDPGSQVLRVRYRLTDGGQGELELLAGDDSLGVAGVEQAMPVAWQHGGTGLRIGADVGLAVGDDYTPPFSWAGTIDRVVVSGQAPDLRAVEGQLSEALRSE